MRLPKLFRPRRSRRHRTAHTKLRKAASAPSPMLFEPLEQRLLLSVIPVATMLENQAAEAQPHAQAERLQSTAAADAVLVALRNGLQGLTDWSGRLDNASILRTNLPVVGKSLGQALNGGEAGGQLLRRL